MAGYYLWRRGQIPGWEMEFGIWITKLRRKWGTAQRNKVIIRMDSFGVARAFGLYFDVNFESQTKSSLPRVFSHALSL